MENEKIILHSDMNNCFASIECILNPDLKGLPIAVCGREENRHGIVLAKSEEAKKYGVKTAEAIWEARNKCKDLVIVRPHYSEYQKYSLLAQKIYGRYTDQVEPYGCDEAWLDVTESTKLFGNGLDIAQKIRSDIKEELKLTVSIGVSFTKYFAKLGSDLKKPDAVTHIPKAYFKEIVWPLPVEKLLYVGRATRKKLNWYSIKTIGDLANASTKFLTSKLGKWGQYLWEAANGLDNSRVKKDGCQVPIKSIGHGITCDADLVNIEEVYNVFLELSQKVSMRLREHQLMAQGVQIAVRDNQLVTRQFQGLLDYPTQTTRILTNQGMILFKDNYKWSFNIRSLTIRAIHLLPANTPVQLELFKNIAYYDKQEKIDETLYHLRKRFGNKAITYLSLLGENKMSWTKDEEMIMPNRMYE